MLDGMVKKAIGGLVRHALGALSGVLIGAGMANELVLNFVNASEQLILGSAGVLVAYVLSLVNSKNLLKLIGR